MFIPKPDGKQRPLGIASIRDRVVQMAAVLVLEPIFEADLEPEQHAYRPDHSALDAVRQVHGLVSTGHTEVVDADLSGYFDSIPHAELMKSLSRRISDRHLLRLIKMWLEAPVEETDERGRTHRTTRNKDEGRGSPQGSPLSPLLANIYMRRFIVGWKILGHEQRLDAHIVNYADDFVICCRGTADEAMTAMRAHDVEAEADGERDEDAAVPPARGDVRLPGVHDRPVPLAADGQVLHRDAAVGEEDRPPLRRDQRADRAGDGSGRTVEDRVARLNRKLLGWSNYFCLGPVSPAYRAIDRHARHRLRQWLRAKHKRAESGDVTVPRPVPARRAGPGPLERPSSKSFPWANA